MDRRGRSVSEGLDRGVGKCLSERVAVLPPGDLVTVRSMGGLSLWRPVRSAYKVRGGGARAECPTDRRLSGRLARSVHDASRHEDIWQRRLSGEASGFEAAFFLPRRAPPAAGEGSAAGERMLRKSKQGREGKAAHRERGRFALWPIKR